MLFEPLPDWHVVRFQRGVGNCNRRYENPRGDPYVGAKRQVRMACLPVHVDVYHWVVSYVERVGFFAQEFAHACAVFSPNSGLPAPAATMNGKIIITAAALYVPLAMFGVSPPTCGAQSTAARMTGHHRKPLLPKDILLPSL